MKIGFAGPDLSGGSAIAGIGAQIRGLAPVHAVHEPSPAHIRRGIRIPGVMTRVSAGGGWSLSDTEMFVRYGEACVPRRAGQVSIVCDLLSDLPAEMVLDLCCGEGLLAGEYAAVTRLRRVTPLSTARPRCSPSRRGGSPAWARASSGSGPASPIWAGGPASRYGAVMTSLAVHHLGRGGQAAALP